MERKIGNRDGRIERQMGEKNSIKTKNARQKDEGEEGRNGVKEKQRENGESATGGKDGRERYGEERNEIQSDKGRERKMGREGEGWRRERNEGEREVKWGGEEDMGRGSVKREMRRDEGEMRNKGQETEI